MIYTYTNLTFRVALKWYLFTFLLNTFFAVFFWSISKEFSFTHHFIFSQCNGFAILNFAAFAAQMTFKNAAPHIRLINIFFFAAIGSIAGKMLASVVLDIGFLPYREFAFLLVLNLMIVAIIIGFLYYWEGIAETGSRIQEERKKQLDMEKKMAQTQLKLIQSQIDPGFLFNILNEVLNLLDAEPEKAKSMQLSLIQYLRLSLFNFKKEAHTVSQEMEMINAYLNIRKAQSRNKMSFRIEAEKSVREMIIPTMMLHSVVEKMAALEPESLGGSIIVRCLENDGQLRFEVVRSGISGNAGNTRADMFEDIRYRLKKIFGDQGAIRIKKDESGELKAVIALATDPTASWSDAAKLTSDPQKELNRLQYAFKPV